MHHPKFLDSLLFPQAKRYTVRDLSISLTTNAATRLANRLSQHELETLQGPVPEIENEYDLTRLASSFFPLFDKAFFFGVLRRGMHPSLPILTYNSADQDEGFYSHKQRQIQLNLNVEPPHGTSVGQRQLCVLLHEMLHAFLEIYACGCRECRKRAAAGAGMGVGESGHGKEWCSAMSALQGALQDGVRWDVDCGIQVSVAIEVRASGWGPRGDLLRRWGVDEEQLSQDIEGMVGVTVQRRIFAFLWMK
ncbi:uncharacterized protein L3040_006524 [Drepanopeziza brunnea f. sp. 'multigermtubi']|uniref:uncharacterized protein n=1 Tax=Drepanopeziza brunnea f. sp. 'multigermtubi' TaxID=698441 RepID=UPI002386C585|nr:hypothetical protein L3040_006524 [Drepanopeziza brunnea f. sp. 'multigermtubi']